MLKKILSACFLVSMGPVFSQSQSDLQKAYSVTGSTKLTDGTTMMFRLLVPKNYDPAKKYPIILHMHGIGERGNNNTAQLSYEIAKPWVSDSVQSKWSTFALAPQCPANGQWAGTAGDGAVKVLDSLKKVYSLDTTRFYVGGLSWGGMGTLYIMQKYPAKFAAALPHAGTVSPNGAALAKTAFWAFHGDADATVNVSGSRNAVSAVESAGFPVVKFYAGKKLASPTGISVDSLVKAVRAGRKYLYYEIKNGDHSAGCDEGWKTAMVPGWLFSKAKVNGEVVAWSANGSTHISIPGRSPGAPQVLYSSLVGNTLTLTGGSALRRLSISDAGGQVLLDRKLAGSQAVFELPAMRAGTYFARVDDSRGIRIVKK